MQTNYSNVTFMLIAFGNYYTVVIYGNATWQRKIVQAIKIKLFLSLPHVAWDSDDCNVYYEVGYHPMAV